MGNLCSSTFRSAGFELYVPPTKFSQPSEPACFVMLDDLNDIFFEVKYDDPKLGNTKNWTELSLHEVDDPAIVFKSNQDPFLQQRSYDRVEAYLVSIIKRDSHAFRATILGTVYVRPFAEKFMNWGALESLKGSELPAEMRAGLLRHVFNRRISNDSQHYSYVTPRKILDNMPRKWHEDGGALNWELDDRFVGAKRIAENQNWILS